MLWNLDCNPGFHGVFFKYIYIYIYIYHIIALS